MYFKRHVQWQHTVEPVFTLGYEVERERQEVDSRDKEKNTERKDRDEDEVGGRVRVTTDERNSKCPARMLNSNEVVHT